MSTPATTTEVVSIPISLIDPCHVNPRKNFDEVKLAELAVSIAKMGVTNPVTLRPGWSPVGDEAEQRYELVSGHRRTEAAKRAGLDVVPAIVRELSDREALDLAIVDNLQRVDLSPMEEAEGYAVLMKVAGATKDELEGHAGEIALKVGKTLRYVIQRLKLLSLIPEARDVMRRGYLSLECALLIARLQPEDQERAVFYAVDHRKEAKGDSLQKKLDAAIANMRNQESGWYRVSTEKELREWIATNITVSLKAAPWALDDAELVPAAGACTNCPKRSGNNTVLFGDLTPKEDTCTDPACYESKQKAFVKLTVKESAESGAPVLKLSTSQSHLPIKEGSTLEKTTFKQGQWVEAKKGSCPDTHRGVTQEGQFKNVCVNQKCKVHKHEVQQPQARGERISIAEQEKRRAEEYKRRECLEKAEKPIREKIWTAVLGKLDAATAVKLVADAQRDSAAIRKRLLEAFPKSNGALLEALTVFYSEFVNHAQVNSYWLVQPGGVAKERQVLWSLAKAVGINADAIAAKHFHDAGSIAPAADILYPKGVPWPKDVKPVRETAKSPAKKAPAKQAKKKARLTAEAKKRIAKAMKERWAKSAKKAASK